MVCSDLNKGKLLYKLVALCADLHGYFQLNLRMTAVMCQQIHVLNNSYDHAYPKSY